MPVCNAWEIWSIHNHITDTVVIVNLTPLEGIPFRNEQPDERVSVYLQENDLLKCVGALDDETLISVARAYLQLRRNPE